MARHEADREDLMREATALSPRIELALPGRAQRLVAGSRSGGRLSLYFGADPVYHFDSAGRLGRAYCAGSLYRSQGTTVARLTRHRTPQETRLQRHDLNALELDEFLRAMRRHMAELRETLDAGTVRIVQQVPPEAVFLPILKAAVAAILAADPPLAPAVIGRS